MLMIELLFLFPVSFFFVLFQDWIAWLLAKLHSLVDPWET